MSNVRIDLDGDRATCESYLLGRHLRELDGRRHLLTYAGRYLDRFERRAGRWAIAHRLVVVDWDRAEPIERAPAHERFTPGGRYPNDPAFDWDTSVVRPSS